MIGKHIATFAGSRRFVQYACLGIVGALAGAVAQALATDADIVNAKGFELPDFTTTYLTTGQLEGQVNPMGFGQVASPGQWLRTQGSGASTANVQSTVFAPGGGSQAVKVDRAANDSGRWEVPVNNQGYPDYPNPQPPEPQQPCICITWDMRVEQAAGDGVNTFGPFFGVQAFDDDGNPVARLGALGVDATTGDVVYTAAGSGNVTDTGSLISFGAWNRFQIKLDYSTHEYSVFLGNIMLAGPVQYVDDAAYPGQLNQFSDAGIAALAIAGDPASQALAGTAYYDNFLIREGTCPIPEPSTLLIVAMGSLLGAIGTRRRRVIIA